MAWEREGMSMILTSERSLRSGVSDGFGLGGGRDVLGFELVGEDEVGVGDEAAVDGDDVLGDVEGAVVAHDGVEDPEEAAGAGGRFGFELLGDGADGFEG